VNSWALFAGQEVGGRLVAGHEDQLHVRKPVIHSFYFQDLT
jgi:hypothetical protein